MTDFKSICFSFTLLSFYFTFYTYTTLLLNSHIVYGFWFTNAFESTYGSWRLLYTDNTNIYHETPTCLLAILPSTELEKATVRITWRSSTHGLVIEKSSLSVVKCLGNTNTTWCDKYYRVSKSELASYTGDFTILSSQKTVRSIWFFGLPPYVNKKYASSLPSNLRVQWKIDNMLRRLYICYGNYVYVFDRCTVDTTIGNHVLSEQTTQVVALNVFLITQLLSYIFEKLVNGIFDDIYSP